MKVSVIDTMSPPMLCLNCHHDYAVTNPLWSINNELPSDLENTALREYGAMYIGTNLYNESTVCLELTTTAQDAISRWTVDCVVRDIRSNSVSLKKWLPGEV